jgi:uroporphyrinogen-III decarboxylase
VMNSLRGMAGTMLDMYRQPDRLLELIDVFEKRSMARIAAMPRRTDAPRVFMATHRGSDGFMSIRQFERFYWPGLKKVILAVIETGVVPCIFFEGNWTQRIEYLLELPKGKVMAHLDSTDIFRAKEVLKDHICLRGNVPGSLLSAGSAQDVKDYCKKLIDVVGKGGGLVMCPRVVPDEATAENVHAMIDFTKEYGVYR